MSDVLQQCEAQMLQGRVQFLLCPGHIGVAGRLDPALHRSVQVGADRLLAAGVSPAGANVAVDGRYEALPCGLRAGLEPYRTP